MLDMNKNLYIYFIFSSMATSVRLTGSDEDRTRFSRLILVIIDELTQILQDLLLNEIPSTQIYNKALPHIKNLQCKQILIIRNASKQGYKDFDITLLYTLLRNICQKIAPPSQNWGVSNMPSQTEITVGDDIERIRIIRNNVCGHIPEAAIPETEFKEYWSIISGICGRMQTLLNKDYVQRLQDAKECSIDADTENKYTELFKRLADEEKTTRDLIQSKLTGKTYDQTLQKYMGFTAWRKHPLGELFIHNTSYIF